MKTKQELETGLNQFYGTDAYHSITGDVVITDGVKWLCDNAKCYWLVSAIASHQHTAMKNKKLADAQFWALNVDQVTNTAVLSCTDGDNDKQLIRQEIPYTDFPLDTISLYCMRGGDNGKLKVILLPSEY
jgi:hypothetical protein